MPLNPRCPSCGTLLPSSSPEELCPRCLMKAGLHTEVTVLSDEAKAASGRSSNGFTPADIAEMNAVFPQFEFIELLGRGGMGAVYKARQKDLDRLVAVKVLPKELAQSPGFAERFSREARALAKLTHPHIVTVHEFGQAGGLFFLVMEFVDGVNLRQAFQAGRLTPEQALEIVPQICDALQFAHEEGIVHRDIKPENILLDKRGRVRIADFGLAKLLGKTESEPTLTGQYQVMGTLRYMAPEQMEGSHDVDHRADIFSLGVVFYEMLTGELPVGRFAPPSQKVRVDVRLDEVVLRALEQKPEQRYQHASEMNTHLELLRGLSPIALRRAFGMEYKSKATLFGWPLVHICFGIDPQTGRKRVAKGVVAIGDAAIGVFASGGLAMGGVTFGGMSVGLISFGGLAAGLLAIGGLAFGGFAWGGCGVGVIAMGGMAAGYYAFGGAAFGAHTLSSQGRDPVAAAFFEPWAYQWTKWLTWMCVVLPLANLLVFLVVWLVMRRVQRGQTK
ncbi:MAG: protein kinase [Planctomycetales bacterium]|nr:protein kinase [Planctomycetales bacterium]